MSNMLQVIRQTREERIVTYMKCTKKEIINMLLERDKHKRILKRNNVPAELIKTEKEYNKLLKYDLAALISDREIYEAPNWCTECDALAESNFVITDNISSTEIEPTKQESNVIINPKQYGRLFKKAIKKYNIKNE